MPRTSKSGAAAAHDAGAPSAVRALRILEYLAERGTGVRPADIACALSLPKSSTHLLLTTLVDYGWVDLDEKTRELSLGLKAWEVGQGYARAKSLTERASRHMDAVRNALGETVRLAVLDGIENVYVAKSDGGQALALDTAIGSRLPAYATGLGKVLLADLSREELQRRFRDVAFECFTSRTIDSITSLERALETVRRRGYGEDRGEYVSGVHCVAVPVRDRDGRVIAAMSVSVPSVRFQRTHRLHALSALLEAGSRLSQELGAPEVAPQAPLSARRPRESNSPTNLPRQGSSSANAGA